MSRIKLAERSQSYTIVIFVYIKTETLNNFLFSPYTFHIIIVSTNCDYTVACQRLLLSS